MTTEIHRHKYPTHAGIQRYWEVNQEDLPKIPELLTVQMANFDSFISQSQTQTGLGLVLNRPQDEVCAWLHIGRDISLGLFECTRHHGEEKEVTIAVMDSRIVVPTGRTRYGTPTQWLWSFAVSMGLRDQDALSQLARHNPHGDYETHSAIWGDALIIWLTDDQDPSELLEVAAGYTEEAEYQPDLAVKVHKPLILATQAIYDEDADRFNECLADALRGHKAVLGTGEAANSPANLLSIEALGLCSLAYDRGIPIEVESGYIPKWIYEGGCKERPDLQAYVREVSGA